MFITFYVSGLPFNGNTIPSGKGLGGSESAGYYMAKELAKLGHTVTIFTSDKQCGTWDGVRYQYHGEISEQFPMGDGYHFYSQIPQDVTIVQRHPRAFALPNNSKLNFWWLHDLALHRYEPAIQDSLVNIDNIITVSNFHKHQVEQVYGIDNQKIVIASKNGVDYNQIQNALSTTNKDQIHLKKHLIFASRPERGLEELVDENGIMLDPRLKDYHLHVCGYDNTTPQTKQLYDYLHGRCNSLSNVTFHGALGKDDLYRLIESCQVYVYPTMFEDTSNILALECAACGTPFIGVENGALPETCSSGFARLVKPKNNQLVKDDFIKVLLSVCKKEDQWQKLHFAGLSHNQSWKDIAKEWDEIFQSKLYNKGRNKTALIKHYEQMSDIVALRDLFPDDEIEKVLPTFKRDYDFLINDTFKEHYKAMYEYEKNRGQIYGPEEMTGNKRFESIYDFVKENNPKTVLDYGCAHGLVIINLAKRLPNIQFTGVDLAQSNVDIATKWVNDENISNVKLYQKEHNELTGSYDLIIATEVLEHVKDIREVVNTLLIHLNPGGHLVIGVPYGPWEAIGYKKHPGWRAHIHHLERQDLKELFSHFDDYKIICIPTNHNLGHYILSFKKPDDDRECGYIDYKRKHSQQAPRQTLSCCMIVKDGEFDVGKSINSIKDMVDEIIVGVDKNTTDNTRQVLDNLGVSHFDIPSPLDIGFDEARNLTIKKAQHDWIVWIDADETIENIREIPRLLRDNPFNGYAIKQHHFSVDPLDILQTDYPVKIFRNKHGIQFYGYVHEHPCRGNYNTSVGKHYVPQNLHVMHLGYSTEEKRRNRFLRNFPLIQKDREKYSKRILGKTLFLRDLAHFIRYETEIHGVITNKCIDAAKQGIILFNELINEETFYLRFIVTSLIYYSECVRIFNPQPIKYEAKVRDIEIKGLFMDQKIILVLMNRINKHLTDIHMERYL